MLMKTKYLPPNQFKKTGWIIFIVMLIFFIWETIADNCGMEIALRMPKWLRSDIYTILPVGFSIALLLIAFAKEKVEDEYIMKIRSDSLILAVLVNYIVVIIGSLLFYDLDYLSFMIYNMFTTIVLYIIIFNVALYKLRKSMRHEEQA